VFGAFTTGIESLKEMNVLAQCFLFILCRLVRKACKRRVKDLPCRVS
jgi:hypothetical protein